MSKIYPSLAVLVLPRGGLMGCDDESQAVEDVNPVRVAEMTQSLRELWLGHIYWVERAVVNHATNSLAERNVAEQEVVANAQQIANMMTPFYGEARSEELFTLLVSHIAALKEYAEATVAGHTRQQGAARTGLASNVDDLAVFFHGVNPDHLPKDTVRGLIAAHVAHHVLQINQHTNKEYARLEATWPMMRQHVYLIADTLTAALAKQCPDKFS